MTGKGGFCVWSTITGMRPFGLRRRNQSFFCSFVEMFLEGILVYPSSMYNGPEENIVHEGCSPFNVLVYIG